MRLMGLDVGDKTVGVAVSDELGISAQPVTVIRRTDSVKKDVWEILRIAEERGVGKIVVGLPLMMDGTVGVQAQKVEEFTEAIRRRTKIPIVMWDERLTTSEVERMLIAADESRAKRKQVIDKLAATVLLQSYMDYQSAAARRKKESDDE